MKKEQRVIDRLIEFAKWCKNGKMVKSRAEFERVCGISNNYLYNTMINTKNSVGIDNIAKIHKAFPMLNLTWVVTGKGSMIETMPDEGYKEAYESLLKKINSIKKAINKL